MPTSTIILVLTSTFLHAGWYLLVGSQQRTSHTLLRIILVIVAVGLGPALAAELLGSHFPVQIWGYLAITGMFQAVYHFGLAQGCLPNSLFCQVMISIVGDNKDSPDQKEEAEADLNYVPEDAY